MARKTTTTPKGNTMDPDLAAVKDAMDKSTGDGRDYDKACKLADAYVAKHPEQFGQFRDLSIEDCVRAVDVFRDANMVEDQWRVEAWILHSWEPLNVGGGFQAQARLTPNTN